MKVLNEEMWDSIQYGSDEWETVDDGVWVQDGKYQSKDVVIKHLLTGKFYKYSISRSGSPFTDWYYDYEDSGYPELDEVEKKTVTVITETWQYV